MVSPLFCRKFSGTYSAAGSMGHTLADIILLNPHNTSAFTDGETALGIA